MIQTTVSSHLIGGVNSPVRAKIPFRATSAQGAYIFDTDGNRYIDFCQSWGASILGHADPVVTEAVVTQCRNGSSYGVTNEYEMDLAAHIVGAVPSVEAIRFVSSGTEATMTALRIARGYTGKTHVLKFDGNYHGHADPFLVRAGSGLTSLPEASSQGIPEAVTDTTISIPYNDIDALEKAFSQIDFAAVIVEPIAGNMGLIPADPVWLKKVRTLTEEHGCVLIFDEVISGFRVGVDGAQGLYGIQPDLTTFGKVIGAGFPVGAVGGKRAVMDVVAPNGPVYQAGTLSGNPVAMRAGITALSEMVRRDGYSRLELLGKRLEAGITDVVLQRVGSLFTPFFGSGLPQCKTDVDRCDHEAYASFFAFCLSRGIFLPPLQYETAFLTLAHSEDMVDQFIEVVLDFCDGL